jgi:hypothetical protein
MFRTWINFFKRSPRAGDGKDRTMSHPSESPGPVPGNATDVSMAPAPPAPAQDVVRQIADLTDAVNRLVQAQQTAALPSVPTRAPTDIGGDLPGGEPPRVGIDVSKLSPLQQIALGLRDAKSVGPAAPAVLHATRNAARRDAEDAAPVGAD